MFDFCTCCCSTFFLFWCFFCCFWCQNGVTSSIKPQQVTYIVPGIEDFNHEDIADFIRKTRDLLVSSIIDCECFVSYVRELWLGLRIVLMSIVGPCNFGVCLGGAFGEEQVSDCWGVSGGIVFGLPCLLFYWACLNTNAISFLQILYGSRDPLESYCSHLLLSEDDVYFTVSECKGSYTVYHPRPSVLVG